MRATTRRDFLATTGAALAAGAVCPQLFSAPARRKRKVAAIVTVYNHNSHADVIVSRILQSHTLDGKGTWPNAPWPDLQLASLYVDQSGPKDKSRQLATEHGFRLCGSIAEALTLGGTDLAVDGVLLIGEHGSYPLSDTGQIMYPRRRFFEETVAVFRRSGRTVPVFQDKHFTWNWEDAHWIYNTARQLRIPLMAGSSVPGTWRRPVLEMQRGTRATEAVALSYGPLEAYIFHALEALQCLAERRRGGETGVAAVQFMEGPAVWQARDAGRFDGAILEAALARRENKNRFKGRFEVAVKKPVACFIEYRDGFRATVLHDEHDGNNEWVVAWREQGKKDLPATLFWTQEERPLGHFAFLLQGVERMIHTGKPTWPVERTLLTTGVLAALFISRQRGGTRVETPQLAMRYKPTFTWQEPAPPPPGRPFNVQ